MTPQEKLNTHRKLLMQWQKNLNLIAPSTIEDMRARHFDDSLQLSSHIPNNATLADLGSGAGFPAMVLAILRGDINVHLIESNAKKAAFLQTVSRETGTKVNVHAKRVEVLYDEIAPDIITARAFASLDKICNYIMPWAENNKNLECILLKGAKTCEEIEKAQEKFKFSVEIFQSETSIDGKIVRLRDISVK